MGQSRLLITTGLEWEDPTEAETTLEEVVAPLPLVHQLAPLMTNKGNHLATSNSTPRAQACIAQFTLWEAGLPTAPTSLKEHHLPEEVIPVSQLEAITTRDPLLPTERRAATITASTTAVPWAIRQAHPRGKRRQTRVAELDLGRLRARLAPPDRDQGLQGSRMQP